MNALVYTSLFPNNIQPNNGIFIKQRMFAFAKLNGCEIKVVAPVPYSPPWPFLGRWYGASQIKSREITEGIEIFHPRYGLIPKISMVIHGFSMFLSSIRLIKNISTRYSIDIIDAHYIYPDGFAAVLLGQSLKKPVVLSARGSDINHFSKLPMIVPMLRFALRKADHIIAVCNALRDEMVRLGVSIDKIAVISNGVNLDTFAPEDRLLARKRLGIRADEKILLSIGWLIPRKGFHLILEAMPTLLRQHPDLTLYIIGEGPCRKDLEGLISGLNLGGRVHLLGEKANSELKYWYNAADVFCLASSREGWPNVLMESLACATPVVATNVWGAPEIVTSRDIGLLVERSPHAIAQGLIHAFSKDWDRDTIRAHVAYRSWHKVASEVREVFANTIEKRAAPKIYS